MKTFKRHTPMLNNIRVMGIDPGYERLGIAVIEKELKGLETLVFSECIKTSPKDPQSKRLFHISNSVDDCIEKHKPTVMALETLFFNTNQKTAVKVAEARGVIISRAGFYGLDVYEFSPLQVKQAITGYGRCEKRQIISTLPHIIKIDKEIRYDDEFDAIAVGLTCTAVLRNVHFD